MVETPTKVVAQLCWGLKQSFRAYVEAAGGTIEVGAGAERTADGGFAFALVPGEGLGLSDDGKLEGVGRFAGQVLCRAHGGMLNVFLADPVVEIRSAGAVITVADTPARDQRVTLAELDLGGATIEDGGDMAIPTKLSRDGWKVLGDHYAPGAPLDPVCLRLA